MGLDYSFEMLVPRESLFEFLGHVSRLDGTGELDSLVWPDGRRLVPITPVGRSLGSNMTDLIPFDDSLEDDQSFCLSFKFEADDELRLYDLESQEDHRLNGREITSCLEGGYYRIGCIWMAVALSPNYFRWFGDMPLYTLVTFTAATTRMSLLFSKSVSVQRFFRDLAAQAGAIYCGLDRENDDVETLYVADEARDLPLQWISGHATEITGDNSREGATNELWRQINLCSQLENSLKPVIVEPDERYFESQDAGLRAAAYKACGRSSLEAGLARLEKGLVDQDWRVRAVATYCLGNLYLPRQFERRPGAISALSRALNDAHPEVRTVAAGQLRYFNGALVFGLQLSMFAGKSLDPENLGMLKQALSGLRMNKAGWNVAVLVEKRLAEPDFPFPNQAKDTIERLRTLPEIGEPEA